MARIPQAFGRVICISRRSILGLAMRRAYVYERWLLVRPGQDRQDSLRQIRVSMKNHTLPLGVQIHLVGEGHFTLLCWGV